MALHIYTKLGPIICAYIIKIAMYIIIAIHNKIIDSEGDEIGENDRFSVK